MAFTNLGQNQTITLTKAMDLETLVDIGAVPAVKVRDLNRVSLSLGSAGGSTIALDQFVFLGSVDAGVTFQEIRTAWATPAGAFLDGGNLASLPHATIRMAILDVSGLDQIKFQSAQAGVTASAVTITLTLFGQV